MYKHRAVNCPIRRQFIDAKYVPEGFNVFDPMAMAAPCKETYDPVIAKCFYYNYREGKHRPNFGENGTTHQIIYCVRQPTKYKHVAKANDGRKESNTAEEYIQAEK